MLANRRKLLGNFTEMSKRCPLSSALCAIKSLEELFLRNIANFNSFSLELCFVLLEIVDDSHFFPQVCFEEVVSAKSKNQHQMPGLLKATFDALTSDVKWSFSTKN